MLNVNMDGIVLLRFQALCLRISALITALCLFAILPMNLTARCYYEEYEGAPMACFNYAQTNLTNYEVTTMANIPDLFNVTSPLLDSVFSIERINSLGRFYGIVLCTWIVYYVACKRMHLEWKSLLALRRVYYLERDHWSERRRELENSLLRSRKDDAEDGTMDKRDPWIPVSLEECHENLCRA